MNDEEKAKRQLLDQLATNGNLPPLYIHVENVVQLYQRFLNSYDKRERIELLGGIHDFALGLAAVAKITSAEPYGEIYNQLEKEI